MRWTCKQIIFFPVFGPLWVMWCYLRFYSPSVIFKGIFFSLSTIYHLLSLHSSFFVIYVCVRIYLFTRSLFCMWLLFFSHFPFLHSIHYVEKLSFFPFLPVSIFYQLCRISSSSSSSPFSISHAASTGINKIVFMLFVYCILWFASS